ncbi:MAG: fibronectin type III domain-containing protein [Treponema sp.]
MKRFYKIQLAVSVLCSAVLLSCSDLFENRIPMQSSSSSLVKLVVPDVEIEKLDAPGQIFVSQAEFPTTINVAWSAVEGATSYRLERALAVEKDSAGNYIVPDESEFEVLPLCQRLYGTTYTDTILKNPKYTDEEYSYRYFYRVCAENPRLKYESSDFTVSEEAFLLAPPANVTASLGEAQDKIVVRWNKTENASYYDIYRSHSSDGSSPVQIKSVTSNQNFCEDYISSAEQGVDFYYTVKARTSSASSIASGLALGYALKDGAPGKVKDVKVEEGKGRGETNNSISISWTKVEGEGIKYAVYRTSSKDSSYTLVNGEVTSLSYTDTKSLKPNVYYYYQVQAFKVEGEGENAEKIKGPFSDSGRTSSEPAEGFILSPPESVSVLKNSSNPDECIITFTAALGSKDCPSDSGLSDKYNEYSYKILGSDNKDSGYVDVDTVSDTSLVALDGGYYRVSVDACKFYKIVTVNGTVESAESDVCAPVPFAAKDVQVSQALYIAGYTDDDSMANAQGVFPVKISWQPPAEEDADGGYYVYRSAKKDSGFKKITENPVTGLEYVDVDENTKAGVYYYYRVLSLNSLLQGANYSDTKEGWGALTANQYMREYNKTVMSSQKKLTLMHKSNDMDKLGSESADGTLSGNLSYNASVAGLGARITMHYTNYADFYANGDAANGYYFFLNGDTNTSASMDASGSMDGTVDCKGMYPGSVNYNSLKIKGGAAGGGSYVISRSGFAGSINVDWKVGEEGK